MVAHGQVCAMCSRSRRAVRVGRSLGVCPAWTVGVTWSGVVRLSPSADARAWRRRPVASGAHQPEPLVTDLRDRRSLTAEEPVHAPPPATTSSTRQSRSSRRPTPKPPASTTRNSPPSTTNYGTTPPPPTATSPRSNAGHSTTKTPKSKQGSRTCASSPSNCGPTRPASNSILINHLRGPSREDLAIIRGQIAEIITTGGHNAKKALFEALIEEVQILSDDSVVPRFRIPTARNGEGLTLEPALDQLPANDTVRVPPHPVDRMWQNPNRIPAAQGPVVTVAAVRRREP